MYNTTKTVARIKETARKKKIKISDMLSQCELSITTLSSMKSRGSWIQANSLAKIADYLDVSVDYLLGRTDESNKYNSINNFDTTVSGTQVSGNNATINNKETSSEDAELLNLIKNLSLVERSKVVLFIDEMKNKEV